MRYTYYFEGDVELIDYSTSQSKIPNTFEYPYKYLALEGVSIAMPIRDETFDMLRDKLSANKSTCKDKLDEAKVRIKELEEGLRFYAEQKHLSDYRSVSEMPSDMSKTYIGTDDQSVYAEDGTTARKALEKESE